ncbi:MAG: BatA domain-containing protein [Planctomycetota bacterium]
MISVESIIVAAFEFLSMPMLGWLAAAALPWLIHRIYRKQHHTTSWAAVELLLAAMNSRSRRVHMQQWLLLAVRTMILVCVVLAAAEPGLRGWTIDSEATSRTHRVIVIDRSFSMGCARDGVSRWDRAKAQARQWIENANGDPITLIAWGHQAESVLGRPTFDASVVLSALEDLQLSDATADIRTAARAVVQAIERCEAEMPQVTQQHVMFYTDFCQPTWSFDESQIKPLEALGGRVPLTMVDVTERGRQNMAVTAVRAEPEVILRHGEAKISATLNNFGLRANRRTRVNLQIDGRLIDERSVELTPGQQTTVNFSHRFIDEGQKLIVVSMSDVDDALAIDDRRVSVVHVRPQLRVACVAGFPHAATDLARALAPSEGQGESPVQADVYSLSRLAELELSDFAAVFLCGADRLTVREIATLRRYVQQGGGLAVFLDAGLSADQNDQWLALLPADLDSEVVTGDFRFDALDYTHPIVAPFRGQTQAGLLRVIVSRYRRLEIRESDPPHETVLRFDSGDPALIVGRCGLGNVAVSALPASLASQSSDSLPWSTFAVSPSFLPVVRELTNYLVSRGREHQTNLLVGEIALVPWSSTTRKAEVRLPDGRTQPLPLPKSNEPLTFAHTNRAGSYTFLADGSPVAHVVANVDARECDPRPIERTDLPTSVIGQRVSSSSRLTTSGQEFSFVRVLLASALVLLLVEIGLAWTLGRGWG